MSDMPMTPIPIPPEAAASRPNLKALAIGPPRGVTDQDCGTVAALVGVEDGYPMYADYWRPTPEQLEALANGGFIELIQYAPRMVMHSMTVWDVPAAEEAGSVPVDPVAAAIAAWLDRDDVSENRAADEVRRRAVEVAGVVQRAIAPIMAMERAAALLEAAGRPDGERQWNNQGRSGRCDVVDVSTLQSEAGAILDRLGDQ